MSIIENIGLEQKSCPILSDKNNFQNAAKSVWTLKVTIFNISDPRTNDALLIFLNLHFVFIG